MLKINIFLFDKVTLKQNTLATNIISVVLQEDLDLLIKSAFTLIIYRHIDEINVL